MSTNRIHSLYKKKPQELAVSHVRFNERWPPENQEASPGRHQICSTWTLAFSASLAMRNNCFYSRPPGPWQAVRAAQTDEDIMIGIWRRAGRGPGVEVGRHFVWLTGLGFSPRIVGGHQEMLAKEECQE